jgi:competence ComEA-like helix-hairpin-helix protein
LIIDDGDTSDPLISYSGGSTVIQPGGYGVILDQGYSGISEPYTIPVEAILLTVPNAALGSGISTSDPLILWRDGVQISGYAHPFDPGNGIAAERIDPQAADDADNWAPAPCSASPGQANCVSSGGGGGVVSFVVISEVMASPVVSTSGEFIELYNYGDDPVELAGLVISDGDSTDTLVSVSGKSTSLGPGQYGVIIDPDLIPNMTGAPYHLDSAVPVVVTVADTALGNGLAKSDPLTLFAADGQTVLSTYAHPLSTDAQSVERIDALEADLPSNWMPSPCVDGHSAGRANCAAGGGGPVEVPPIVINEVMANALDEDRGEFIELYNYGDTAVDVAGFVISDGDATDRIEAFPGFSDTVIPAGGYGVILDPEYADQYSLPTGAVRLAPDDTTLGNSLATNDPITLYLEDGVTVVSTFSFPFNPGNGISVEKRDDSGDAESNWVASPCSSGASPGGLNCASEGGDPPDPNAELVIAEVMANPLVESSGEFIEITNVGAQAIDLAGYLISDGDAVDALQSFAGETTTLAAGGIAVVLDASYPDPGPYDIPLSAVLLTTEDAAIGSGLAIDDTVSLLDPDGVTVISTYNHPFNPGNGVSVERVDLAAPDDPTNWVASPCASGSSPGELNCAGGGGQPGVTVVDVNTASSAELQQVTGIGPSTANAIVNYRTAYGSFESLDQLQVIDSVTGAKVDDWMVAAADEDPFVIGLAGGQEVQVFADLDALFAALPNPATPGAWDGVPVRVQRTVLLSQNDYAEQQNLTFGSWGDESAFEPTAPSTIAVYLDRDPAETSYHRDQTDSVDALADWIKEDGAPYRMPLFYRWSGAHYGWGELEYAHVFAIEGVVEVYGGEWQIRVRAKVDAGLDRVVRIEKWLAPDSWTGIVTVWTYAYKPVVVEATSGYHHCLPYRLALAHPCRQYWFDTYGQWIDVPRCVKFGECYGCMPDWVLFNQAVAEWRNVANQGDGYCFDHDSVEYCFTTAEETTGLDILNNATFTQLTAHCYTNSLANVILANRPFTSIAAYDQTSGVGSTSLWDLLVCYVRSGDWPPAAFGTVARVLQEIPANEYQTVTVDSATVDSRNGSLFEICDPASADCIQVYSSLGLPASLSVGDTVRVTGEVRWYSAGQFWEILVSESGHLVEILQEG